MLYNYGLFWSNLVTDRDEEAFSGHQLISPNVSRDNEFTIVSVTMGWIVIMDATFPTSSLQGHVKLYVLILVMSPPPHQSTV